MIQRHSEVINERSNNDIMIISKINKRVIPPLMVLGLGVSQVAFPTLHFVTRRCRLEHTFPMTFGTIRELAPPGEVPSRGQR